MGCSQKKQWPSDQNEGWFLAHECIRNDFRDTIAAIIQMKSYCQNKKFEQWMSESFRKWWSVVYEFLHHHHDNEERFVFPFMATKVKIEEKVGEEHVELIKALDAINQLVSNLQKINSSNQTEILKILNDLHHQLEQLVNIMEPHLVDEEQKMLPQLRQNFTVEEFEKQVTDKIISSFKGREYLLAHFFRRFKSPQMKVQMAVSALGMPACVANQIIPKECEKYHYSFEYQLVILLDAQQKCYYDLALQNRQKCCYCCCCCY